MTPCRPSVVTSLIVLAAGCLAGCGSNRPAETEAMPTTRPMATDVDPVKATPDYWLDQPAVASVTADDFDRLFGAAERTARAHYFLVDQADRRAGLVVSAPTTSKQFFEVWRNDTGTARGTVESSLATTRRTLRYEFTRNPDGTFTATPKVLVERYATQGHRVTTPALALGAFDPPAEDYDPSFRLHPWDPTYWYATGRDTALEKEIARSVQDRLKR